MLQTYVSINSRRQKKFVVLPWFIKRSEWIVNGIIPVRRQMATVSIYKKPLIGPGRECRRLMHTKKGNAVTALMLFPCPLIALFKSGKPFIGKS